MFQKKFIYKRRIRPDLSPKTIRRKPDRKARPDIQLWFAPLYN